MTQPTLQALEMAARHGDEASRIALANRLLVGFPWGDAQHERGLDLMRQAASGVRAAEAQWLLGAYYLQVSSRPGAHALAAKWLRLAAEAGVAQAIDRLADLHLAGFGVARSPTLAIALQQRLADMGHAQAAWEVGYLHGEEPEPACGSNAASAFLRACALGYPPAYYSLGLRFALGAGVARDAAFARALLRRAADTAFPDASDAADKLAPEIECGPASQRWYETLRDNLDAARPMLAQLNTVVRRQSHVLELVSRLEAHLAAINHPAIRLDAAMRARVAGDGSAPLRAQPRDWAWLSQQRPKIGVSRHWATREECAHVISKVAHAMVPASDYRRGNSANEDAELTSFSGRGRPLGALHSDAVTRALELRVSRMTQSPMERLEPCSIVSYRPGEEYRPHVDYFTEEQITANRTQRRDYGGQRIATFLLYLRAPATGGETVYHRPDVTVSGERGLAVIHYNVTSDGRPDEQSVHSGLPILDGEKWLWRSTLRQHPLYAGESTQA